MGDQDEAGIADIAKRKIAQTKPSESISDGSEEEDSPASGSESKKPEEQTKRIKVIENEIDGEGGGSQASSADVDLEAVDKAVNEVSHGTGPLGSACPDPVRERPSDYTEPIPLSIPVTKLPDLTTKKNIFARVADPDASKERPHKGSSFLQSSFIKQQGQTAAREPEYTFSEPCRISYMDEDEWILLADGELKLLPQKRCLFVRNELKSVLLNFTYEPGMFREENGNLLFKEKGRRSTPTGYEIVDREYQASFPRKDAALKFMSSLESSKEKSGTS